MYNGNTPNSILCAKILEKRVNQPLKGLCQVKREIDVKEVCANEHIALFSAHKVFIMRRKSRGIRVAIHTNCESKIA